MIRRRRKPTGQVPGVPVPSTEKLRRAARVAGWRSGRCARVVTFAEVFEQRLSMIESGRIGTDEDRTEIRRLQKEIEHCEQCDFHILDTQTFRVALQDLVFAAQKAARP